MPLDDHPESVAYFTISDALRGRRRLDSPTGTQGFDVEDGPWEKPKGMHWKTFERLCEEDEWLEEVVDWYLVGKLGALGWIDIRQ